MLQAQDKSFITGTLVLVAVATAVVSAGLLYAGIRSLVTKPGPPSGDTPVVLIGDSIKFKSGSKNVLWQEVTPYKQYSVSMQNPVTSIAIKQKAGADTDDPSSDDSDPKTDRIRVGVSGASSWEVDEFSDASGVAVAKITSDAKNLSLNLYNPAVGSLCPVANGFKRLIYSSIATPAAPSLGQACPNVPIPVTFSKISLTVTTNGSTQSFSPFDCIDDNNSKGICRIVFRDN